MTDVVSKLPAAASNAVPRVEQWMSRDVDRVSTSASLAEVAALMGAHEHSCVLVCDAERPVGLISERDMVRALAAVLSGERAGTAADLMSSPVVTIAAAEPIDEATRSMTAHRIRRLVAVDHDGNVAGLLSQSDLTRAHLARIEAHQTLLEARVAERTAELEAVNEQLETLSRIDPLMGIGNRRAMEEALAMAHQRATRYARSYSVMLLDIDHFKLYNDTYGHPRGDRVLRDVGAEIASAIRMLDTAYRYGGEEMLVLLPETGEDGARSVAERICRSVAALAIEHRRSPHGIVTLSAGLATSHPQPDGSAPGILDLLDAADRSLYGAKNAGRNRIGAITYPG